MRRGAVRIDELLGGGETERADEVVIAPPTWRGHSFIELCEWLVCAKLAKPGSRATWLASKRGGATGVRKVLDARGWNVVERKDGAQRVFEGVVPDPGPRPEPRTFREFDVDFAADWGVFSREHIDEGTRLLIEAAANHDASFVVDIGTGYGAIPIVLAKQGRCARAIGSDVDLAALYLARANAIAAGVDVAFMAEADPANVDASPLTLCEIPTHTPDTAQLLGGLAKRATDGEVLVAVHLALEARYTRSFVEAGCHVGSEHGETHAVLAIRSVESVAPGHQM